MGKTAIELWSERVKAWIGRLPNLQLAEVQTWVDAELERREIETASEERSHDVLNSH